MLPSRGHITNYVEFFPTMFNVNLIWRIQTVGLLQNRWHGREVVSSRRRPHTSTRDKRKFWQLAEVLEILDFTKCGSGDAGQWYLESIISWLQDYYYNYYYSQGASAPLKRCHRDYQEWVVRLSGSRSRPACPISFNMQGLGDRRWLLGWWIDPSPLPAPSLPLSLTSAC